MSVERWSRWVIVLLGILLPVVASGAEEEVPMAEEVPIHLAVGSQKVILLPPEVRGFSVRDEGTLELRPVGRYLLLIGLESGRTEFLLFGPQGPIRRYQVRVVKSMGCTLFICEACRLLPKGHELEIGSAGDRPAIRGIAYSIDEARGVNHLASEFPSFVVDVKLSERALREALLRINHELWREGFLDARVIVQGKDVVLTGHFRSKLEETSAVGTIAPYVEWLSDGLGLPILASEP
jgi:Flp pilus assembly secretin CpaC